MTGGYGGGAANVFAPIIGPARRRRRAAPACPPGRRFCAVGDASRDAAPNHPRNNGARPRSSASPRQARPSTSGLRRFVAYSFLVSATCLAFPADPVRAETAPVATANGDCASVWEEIVFCARQLGFVATKESPHIFVQSETSERVIIALSRIEGCQSAEEKNNLNAYLDAIAENFEQQNGSWRLVSDERKSTPTGNTMHLSYEVTNLNSVNLIVENRTILACTGLFSLVFVRPLTSGRVEDLRSFETIWRATTIPADLREAIER